MLPQHRSRPEKRLGCCRERRHPGEDDRGQLPRRRQPPIPFVQSGDTDLVEQRPAVEGVPFRVGSQPRRAPLRERSQTKSAGELREIAGTEAPEVNPRDPRITAEEPSPAGIDQPTCPRRDDCEHLVGTKPA